jgi:hypothetical protein
VGAVGRDGLEQQRGARDDVGAERPERDQGPARQGGRRARRSPADRRGGDEAPVQALRLPVERAQVDLPQVAELPDRRPTCVLVLVSTAWTSMLPPRLVPALRSVSPSRSAPRDTTGSFSSVSAARPTGLPA